MSIDSAVAEALAGMSAQAIEQTIQVDIDDEDETAGGDEIGRFTHNGETYFIVETRVTIVKASS